MDLLSFCMNTFNFDLFFGSCLILQRFSSQQLFYEGCIMDSWIFKNYYNFENSKTGESYYQFNPLNDCFVVLYVNIIRQLFLMMLNCGLLRKSLKTLNALPTDILLYIHRPSL